MNLPILIPTSLMFILLATDWKTSQANAQTPTLPDDPSVKLTIERPRKRDLPYLASQAFFAGGTAMDMTTTADGLDHPTTAYRSNGTFLAYYYDREAMFPGSLWNRNASAVVTVDALLNGGFGEWNRRFYRGGHRKLAITLTLLNGAGHWAFAIHNMQANGSVDKRVALATGYTGRIYWGKPPR